MPNQVNNTQINNSDNQEAQNNLQQSLEEIKLKVTELQDIEGFFEVVSIVPTYTPKKLYDQIKIVNGDGVQSLYGYDYKNHLWIPIGAKYAFGSATIAGGAMNDTIEYTCGFRPKFIKIIAAMTGTFNGMSWGVGTGTQEGEFRCLYKEGYTNWAIQGQESYIVYCQRYYSGTPTLMGTLTAISDTSFSIHYVTSDSNTENTVIQWEAYG